MLTGSRIHVVVVVVAVVVVVVVVPVANGQTPLCSFCYRAQLTTATSLSSCVKTVESVGMYCGWFS